MQQNPDSVECDVIDLDEYCQEAEVNRINLLKIDVQGFENEVLCGAKDLIEKGRIDVILTEIEFDEVYGRGNSFYELESHLVPHGYRLYDLSHIYKDLRLGRTCWVDAIYVQEDHLKNVLETIKKENDVRA